MEIIKKKICLEDFISRIPALIETLENEKVEINPNDGSWGKIPTSVIILGKNTKYKTFMKLYYTLLNVIVYSDYYEYDSSIKKWLHKKDFDWRDTFKNRENVKFDCILPTENVKDKDIIGLTTAENVFNFYDEVKNLTGNSYTGFDIIEDINLIIGRRIVPYIW